MQTVKFDNLFLGLSGNRTGNQTLRGGSQEWYALDGTNTNRYASIVSGGQTNVLNYDDAGNLKTDRNGYSYDYDYENRISSIFLDANLNGVFESGDTPIVEYTYDALNRRIKKEDLVTSANTRLYYYSDKWQVLKEYDGSGNSKAMYVYGNYIDEVLYTENTSGIFYYLHDHLFSPVALVYPFGMVAERYEYNAYGKAAIYDGTFTNTYAATQISNPYLFTGRRLDNLNYNSATNQYDYEIMYYRNRYYDTGMGRFLQHDSLGIVPNAQNPNKFQVARQFSDGMNIYQYVKSNPRIYTDPEGQLKRKMHRDRFSWDFELWEDDKWIDDHYMTFYLSIIVTCECKKGCWSPKITGSDGGPYPGGLVNWEGVYNPSQLVMYHDTQSIPFPKPCKNQTDILWAGTATGGVMSGYLSALSMSMDALDSSTGLMGDLGFLTLIPDMFASSIGSWGAGFYLARSYECDQDGFLSLASRSRADTFVKDSGISEFYWKIN